MKSSMNVGPTMDPVRRRQLIDDERGVGTIRSKVGPWLLPCIFTECDKPARREHVVVLAEPQKNLFYWFCSARHRVLWINAPKDLGNLPTGWKGLIT